MRKTLEETKYSKVGVTGPNGRVGSELVRRGCVPIRCDVSNYDAIYKLAVETGIEVIIHCAAETDVDKCEQFFMSALSSNCNGTRNVVDVCDLLNLKMILISTNHVFNGKKIFGKYKESDLPLPLNVYGMSKLSAESFLRLTLYEERFKTIRTSTLYESPKTIPYIKDYFEYPSIFPIIDVPTPIKRTFLSVTHFVDGVLACIDKFDTIPRILNISGTESLSWYEFVLGAATYLDIPKSCFRPRTKYLEKGFAPRPKNGCLDVSKAKRLGIPLYSGLDFDA